MKKLLVVFLLCGAVSPIFSQPYPGKRIVIKEQTVQAVTTTPADVTRTLGGYVALLNASEVQVNLKGVTSNFFVLPSPGLDTQMFFNNRQPIYVKSTSGTVSVNVLVYDYE